MCLSSCLPAAEVRPTRLERGAEGKCRTLRPGPVANICGKHLYEASQGIVPFQRLRSLAFLCLSCTYNTLSLIAELSSQSAPVCGLAVVEVYRTWYEITTPGRDEHTFLIGRRKKHVDSHQLKFLARTLRLEFQSPSAPRVFSSKLVTFSINSRQSRPRLSRLLFTRLVAIV